RGRRVACEARGSSMRGGFQTVASSPDGGASREERAERTQVREHAPQREASPAGRAAGLETAPSSAPIDVAWAGDEPLSAVERETAIERKKRSVYIAGPLYDWSWFLLPPLVSLLAGAAMSGTWWTDHRFWLSGRRYTASGLLVGTLTGAH